MTIARSGVNAGVIVEDKTVVLAPGARIHVRFGQLRPLFAQRETLKLTDLDRAPREIRAATYPVIFALG